MLLLNGHLLPTAALPLPNRGLSFGDGFFETLIFADGRLRYAADHHARMQRAAAALHLTLPAPTLPPLGQLPVAAALTALTRLESDLLLGEQRLIEHLNSQVVSQRLPTRVAAVATAEAAVVAPGDTYRAQLLLLSHFVIPGATMTCNGQPIPVGADGVGQVRFRAPLRPGPATWTGSIKLQYNGRDTIFQTVVPYRVARR